MVKLKAPFPIELHYKAHWALFATEFGELNESAQAWVLKLMFSETAGYLPQKRLAARPREIYGALVNAEEVEAAEFWAGLGKKNAAAPELLGACNAAWNFCERIIRREPNLYAEEAKRVNKVIHGAIKKAIGEE